jgi:small subunit ribosomal protein S13
MKTFRLLGISLPVRKSVQIALTAIEGIGIQRAGAILQLAKIRPTIKLLNLNSSQINRLNLAVKQIGVAPAVMTSKYFIARHKYIQSYIGLRHQYKLPVNGQRTRTNAKTCRRS